MTIARVFVYANKSTSCNEYWPSKNVSYGLWILTFKNVVIGLTILCGSIIFLPNTIMYEEVRIIERCVNPDMVRKSRLNTSCPSIYGFDLGLCLTVVTMRKYFQIRVKIGDFIHYSIIWIFYVYNMSIRSFHDYFNSFFVVMYPINSWKFHNSKK